MAARRKSQPAQDEDFYSSLAADFDASEENSSVSDADVNALTKALADMDDMDDALFSSSLKPKKTPSKEGVAPKKKGSARDATPSPAPTPSPGLSRKGTYNISDDLDDDDMFKTHDFGKKADKGSLPEASEEKKSPVLSKTFPGRSKPKSTSFDFGEFDEDDPLAGLLSDDEDAPKTKKKPVAKVTKAPRPAVRDDPPVEEKRPANRQNASASKESLGASQSEDSLLETTPRERDKSKGPPASKPQAKPTVKKSDDIDFGDDDGILDGLGFDDTPRDKPKKTALKVDKEEEAAKAKVNDLFGKTSILDRPPANKGRTKDFQLDSKYRKPQTAPSAPKEEDFTFGGYTPSSVVSKRPDSAPPGRRGVRFADEADGDDDIFGNSTMDRPRRAGGLSRQSSVSSSPTKQAVPQTNSDDWLNEAVGYGGNYSAPSKQKPEEKKQSTEIGRPAVQPDKVTKPSERKDDAKKSGGGGGVAKENTKKPASAADYLGLGGDDIDVDSIAQPKEVTPRGGEKLSKRDSRDDLFNAPAKRDTTSPFPWDDESPRRSRRRNPDLSSTGDLGSTFDSVNFSDDDDNDPLGESDPLRASLIAQQIKQLAAIEKDEPVPKAVDRTPPSAQSTSSKPPSAQTPTPQANLSSTAPLQRQSSTTSLSGDQKPATSGRREPKWRQEMRQQQQQQQGLNTSGNLAATPTTPQFASSQHPSSTSTPLAAPAATPATSGIPQPASATTGLLPPRSSGIGGAVGVLNESQRQLERQRESMVEYEATLKQQQLHMAAEHETQMRLIQEQQQKAMLQQQQQALQQQQESIKQQQAMMQQQMLQSSTPSSMPGLGLGFGLGATPGNGTGLGGASLGGMSSGNPWLENKVRQLEAEKTQLESSIQFLEKHHKQQLETVETNHQSYVSLLEEGARKREARVHQDVEESAKRYEDRLQSVIAERSKVVSEHQGRMEQVYEEHGKELEKLKQIHKQEMEDMRLQNRQELDETRKTMQHHMDSMKDSTSHTKSLKDVVERVGLVGDQINSLQGRVSDQHQFQLDNRLQEVKEREEETKRMKRRLEEQETTMSLERERLQATVSRLEAHIKEQNIQLDEDRWRLRQEQNKLTSLQKMMEEERKVMSDQLASEQTSLQQAKNAVLAEQKSIMGQCMEERKALATERAQFATSRREWEAKMKEEMSKASQEQAMREGTLESLATERNQLSFGRESMRKDQSSLEQRRLELEKDQDELQQEKARLQRLGDSLQARSRELQGMVGDAVRVREEGEAALVKARRIEGQHTTRKQALDHQLEELRATERKIAEDRLQIAENQRSLERSIGSLLCKQCGCSLSMQNIHAPWQEQAPPSNSSYPMMMSSGPAPGFMTSTYFQGGELMPSTTANNRLAQAEHDRTYFQGGEPMPSTTADNRLAQAEHDRTVNVWKLAAERDKEFLDEETSYLESLNNSYRVPAVM